MEKEILTAFLGKTLNIPTEQVATLLYKKSEDDTLTDEIAENALDVLLAKDRERVQSLAPPVDTKTFFDNGYKKAQAEIADRYEDSLRRNFGVDPEKKLKGDDLLTAVKTATATAATDPERVKISTEYLEMERKGREALEAQQAAFQQELEKLKATFEREKQWADISGVLRQTFKGLAPILPKDPEKAERQTSNFIDQNFRGFDFMRTDDGRFLVMKDGQRVNNPHGHPTYLEDLVKQKASDFFEFDVQPPIGNAGNKSDGKPALKFRFKDENDFLQQYATASAEDKPGMEAAFEAFVKGQG